MSRVKIELPSSFTFFCKIPVRITDINYGGHVGNDTILSLLHEARYQYLAHFGYTEMNVAGAGLIMADAAIEFKCELFYGDPLSGAVVAANFSKIGFEIFYKLEKMVDDKKVIVVLAKTSMICYDYIKKKIIPLPEEARNLD